MGVLPWWWKGMGRILGAIGVICLQPPRGLTRVNDGL